MSSDKHDSFEAYWRDASDGCADATPAYQDMMRAWAMDAFRAGQSAHSATAPNRDDVLEEAAKVCDAGVAEQDHNLKREPYNDVMFNIRIGHVRDAIAIRRLKSAPFRRNDEGEGLMHTGPVPESSGVLTSAGEELHHCYGCGKKTAKAEKWESSDGAYTDYKYTCTDPVCRRIRWVDGSDA